MMIYNQEKTAAVGPERFRFVSTERHPTIDEFYVYAHEKDTGVSVRMGVFHTEKEQKSYFEELVRWVDAEREKWCGDEKYTSRILEFHQAADAEYRGKVTFYYDLQNTDGEIRL